MGIRRCCYVTRPARGHAGAPLRSRRLPPAHLRGANLGRANLTGAIFSGTM
ncbi:MAG: pentapeptide repeat-containing protein [Actinobacteria bacterium]|nr:pentapeptide repeat-containing protein [Actinomycetota bacterium]